MNNMADHGTAWNHSAVPAPVSEGPAEPVFQIDNVAVHYGASPAVQQVSMALPAGEITAIIGPSGCGKSTVLASLNRMTDLVDGCRVSGSIRLQGEDIYAPGSDVIALRRRVGMIFQKPNPLPLSIEQNITFPLKQHGMKSAEARRQRTEQVLRQVGLWNEVQERLRAPALRLSGGQQQRLCIARALALEPDVLLMDEPCSALDPIASGVVEDLITSLRGRYTVVVVTHNLAQARRIADQVALFWVQKGAGALVEMNTAERFFNAPQHPLSQAYVSGERG